MEVIVTQSQRGKPLLIVNKYCYGSCKELQNGSFSWRCTHDKCKLLIHTIGNDHKVLDIMGQHNHGPLSENEVSRRCISSSAKRKATDDLCEKPAKIMHLAIAETPRVLKNIRVRDVGYVRKNMYNARRKALPPLPKTRDEAIQNLLSMQIQTLANEPFLEIVDEDSSIVVFTTVTNLRELCKIVRLFIDGTFDYAPKLWYQFFTIHAIDNEHYIPLVFCLLPNKEQSTYERLFELLKMRCRLYGLNFAPTTVVTDFEIGMQNAVRIAWPGVELLACRFHITQAWYRKIQMLGLCREYQDRESEIGQWLRHIFGLPYLDPADVEDCMIMDFMSDIPNDTRVSKFADYIFDNYIYGVWPPEMWAEEGSSQQHTTNACEAFHAVFSKSFYDTHPSIWVFIEGLKTFQTRTYIKMNSVDDEVRTPTSSSTRRQEALQKRLALYRTNKEKCRKSFVHYCSTLTKISRKVQISSEL